MDRADAWLESLAEVGWRPGLDRSIALVEALGSPQTDYRTIHVVGTNGKTSTTLYAAALLDCLGLQSGSLTSPHLGDWTERVRVGGRPIERAAWSSALEATRIEVEALEQRQPALGRVTQFEAATAAGFLALSRAGIEVAVVEAGLGGRLDSTNVLASEVTVLTSIGLDHTEWLGETREEIAGEKLAVLRPGTTLVLGPVPPAVRELAVRTAAGRGARLVEIADPGEGESGPVGRHARTNFEAAVAAVELVAGAVDREARRVALERAGLRGRLELVREEPPVILDVAHNPDGLAAVLEALPELAGDRPLFVVFGCLDDRDPESLLEPFRGRAERLFACLIPDSGGPVGRAGLDPALIAGAAEGLEIPASVIPDPAGALAAAVGEAEAAGAAVLACGSHGLIAEIGRLQP